jgi:hypothetical protein
MSVDDWSRIRAAPIHRGHGLQGVTCAVNAAPISIRRGHDGCVTAQWRRRMTLCSLASGRNIQNRAVSVADLGKSVLRVLEGAAAGFVIMRRAPALIARYLASSEHDQGQLRQVPAVERRQS